MNKKAITCVILISLWVTHATYGLAREAPPERVRPELDVVFVLDSTGSMADEILAVKAHIRSIVEEIRAGEPTPDLRIGIVTYRDHEKEEREYLVKSFDLTSDVDAVLESLKSIKAAGGGDGPEAVVDGLHAATHGLEWRADAKKMVFLIGDAAPHGVGSSDSHYRQGCPAGHTVEGEIEAAIDHGIVIYTISGSGIDRPGIEAFKKIAAETDGEYKALSYQRREAHAYYRESGVEAEFAAPEADSTYRIVDGVATVLTNDLAEFATGAVKAEAAKLGVDYEDAPTPAPTTSVATTHPTEPSPPTEPESEMPAGAWIVGGMVSALGGIILVAKR